MKTLYQNTCPAWHDTKKISKDKWLQNLRGEGVNGTAKRVVYPVTDPQFHDTRNITIQKMNQLYCGSGSAPEPEEPPDLLTDLIAYWAMEEDGAANREDSHTGNYDLTAAGAPPAASGIVGNGSRHSGSPGTTLSNAVFGLTGAFTLAGWVKALSLPPSPPVGGLYFVGKQDKSSASAGFPTTGYMLYFNSGGRLIFWMGNGVSSSEVDSDLIDFDDSTWYFIVCGFNGTDQFIQISNGARNTVVGVAPGIGSQPFTFGGSRGNMNGPEDNVYDEWGVWNRVLTLAEADWLFNSNAGRTYSDL